MTARILLVDDEKAVLFAYKKILQRINVQIDVAETKDESYALLALNRYDAAILDLNLGEFSQYDGLAILQHIKKAHPMTSVIMVTGHGSDDVRERAYQIGVDHYFEKPISTIRLREALVDSGVLSPV